jgi:hypothetical protein
MKLTKENILKCGYKLDESKERINDDHVGGFMFNDHSHYIDVFEDGTVHLFTGNYTAKHKVYSIQDLILFMNDIYSGRIRLKPVEINSKLIARDANRRVSEN